MRYVVEYGALFLSDAIEMYIACWNLVDGLSSKMRAGYSDLLGRGGMPASPHFLKIL